MRLVAKKPPQNVKQKQNCNKFSTNLFKMVQIKKESLKKSKVQFLLFSILASYFSPLENNLLILK